MKLLADENFPVIPYQKFKHNGYDIEHIRYIKPSSSDITVMEYAISQNRIILTFDNDFGTLVFQNGYKPLGVVFYRLVTFSPTEPYQTFVKMIEKGFVLENNFTVIDGENIRQRPIISS